MTEIIFEESSGNVFADLVFDNADEMLMRGKMGIQVIKLLKSRCSATKSIAGNSNFTITVDLRWKQPD
jgi:predicted XRE-type DNA-binding protein